MDKRTRDPHALVAGGVTMNEITPHTPEFPNAENRLDDNQRAAIELLVLGKKTGEVATAIGVDRKTLYHWRHDEVFRDQLAQRRAELWSRASQRLAAMVHPSLDVIERQLTDSYKNISFRAASTILRLAELKKVVEEDE